MAISGEYQALLSLTAGILGALIATSLRSYVERIRWKIEEVYLPLYGHICQYRDDDLLVQNRNTDEYFLPLLQEFEDEKVVLISPSIRDKISETNEKIRLLNKYVRVAEDGLLENSTGKSGTLPDSMIYGGGQPGAINLVYTWNEAPEENPHDKLPDVSTTVINWVGNNGRVLVKAQDTDELRELLIDNQNWSQRWRHKRWTEDQYSAIFAVIADARERWEKETGQDSPEKLFADIQSDIQDLLKMVDSRTSVWGNIT